MPDTEVKPQLQALPLTIRTALEKTAGAFLNEHGVAVRQPNGYVELLVGIRNVAQIYPEAYEQYREGGTQEAVLPTPIAAMVEPVVEAPAQEAKAEEAAEKPAEEVKEEVKEEAPVEKKEEAPAPAPTPAPKAKPGPKPKAPAAAA